MSPKSRAMETDRIKEERYSTNQFYADPPVAVLAPISVSLLWQQERQVAVVWLSIFDGLAEVQEIELIKILAADLRWRLNGMRIERMRDDDEDTPHSWSCRSRSLVNALGCFESCCTICLSSFSRR